MSYNPIESPTPSLSRSEDIPLLPRHGRHLPYPSTSSSAGPSSSHPHHPPPRSDSPRLKPALTLNTTTATTSPPYPTIQIPLPTNAAASLRLDHLRDSVHSIRSPQSRERLSSSPVQTHFSSILAGGVGGPPRLTGWTSTDVFFEHLGTIRALGAEVGQLHASLEGVGVGWGAAGEGKEDKGKESETKEFDDAAVMFEKRQASVEEIMSKLASLSTSLQAFHDLDDPKLGFHPNDTSATPSRAHSGTQQRFPPLRTSTLRNASGVGMNVNGLGVDIL